MSNFKHTPGPWLVSLDGFARKGWAACPTVYACDSDLRYIAFCNDDMTVGEPTDNEANARLIAAAPELLEAAQRSAAALRSGGIVPSATGDNPLEWLLHQTEAAIAKATGEAA
jgi:hypothetical protein